MPDDHGNDHTGFIAGVDVYRSGKRYNDSHGNTLFRGYVDRLDNPFGGSGII
jgi:hypothetical protein